MKYGPRFILLLLLALPLTTLANGLHRAYPVPHGGSDRVIFEFDHRADYRIISRSDDQIEIAFDDAVLSPDFELGELSDQLAIVQGLDTHINENGRLAIVIRLRKQADPVGMTLTSNPWRYALDLSPKSASAPSARPPYIPGDRPFRTTFADADPSDIRLSRTAFVVSMLLVFAAGALSVLVTGYVLQVLRRRFRPAPPAPDLASSPREMLHLELERDLDRLKRTVDWERAELSDGSRQLHDAREKLILQLLREGRELDAIAQALSMTPDQIREILDRHP